MADQKICTTRMSSRGQVVIPESIRVDLNLGEGVEFLVLSEGDVVVLKAISREHAGNYRNAVIRANQEAERFLHTE